ncbi:hypothetical protein NDU88_004811 [Pleurodeles waltl]|uniref:Uncharacterized protein n=1 Tax=Pleurodeles waltl TaxID=8319 RepID=A0AAV7SJW7_PLEWA|nr:hypothetical protein NDU88_004811 [Pleurodeles waltl]
MADVHQYGLTTIYVKSEKVKTDEGSYSVTIAGHEKPKVKSTVPDEVVAQTQTESPGESLGEPPPYGLYPILPAAGYQDPVRVEPKEERIEAQGAEATPTPVPSAPRADPEPSGRDRLVNTLREAAEERIEEEEEWEGGVETPQYEEPADGSQVVTGAEDDEDWDNGFNRSAHEQGVNRRLYNFRLRPTRELNPGDETCGEEEEEQDATELNEERERPGRGEDPCNGNGSENQSDENAESLKEGIQGKQNADEIDKVQFRDPAARHVPGRT